MPLEYNIILLLGLLSGVLLSLGYYYRKWRRDIEEMQKVFSDVLLISQDISNANVELRNILIPKVVKKQQNYNFSGVDELLEVTTPHNP